MSIDRNPVLEEIIPGSECLYILFGGINAKIGMPPFEFYNSCRILDHSRIFLRDFSQSWYQTGLPGIARDIDGIAKNLQQKISELAPQKIYFVGNSMGGFAAILFAALLDQGKAIAFSPQTFISNSKRRLYQDRRWRWKILQTYCKSCFKKHVYDLCEVLTDNHRNFSVEIHVSTGDRLDIAHSDNISDFSQVTVITYEVGGHDLVKYLRDNNHLVSIMLSQ